MTIVGGVEVNDVEFAGANRSLADASPEAVVQWVARRYPGSSVATVSMQNPVLAHLLTRCAPEVPLVFIDTQYHFRPTLEYLRELEGCLDRAITVLTPDLSKDDRWRWDTVACCQARKVDPTREMLTPYEAWFTGVRAGDHSGRATAQYLEYDPRNSVVRANPLLRMSEQDVDDYIRAHDLPTHPLRALGYASIGCWPCTTPVQDGENVRAGRWRGSSKSECGLHFMYEKHPNM